LLLSAAAAVVERRPVVVQLAAFVVVAAVASFLERQVHWHIVAAAAVAVAVAVAVVVVVDTSSPARDFAVAVHIECVALVSKMVQEPQEPEPLASFEVALELEERVVEHPV
jgi:low affinity Fe/Cu permease